MKRLAILLCAAVLFGTAAHGAEEKLIPVPKRPNVRVVDYGADMGYGRYQNAGSRIFSGNGPGRVEFDSDGDGNAKDDSVSGWPFSLEKLFSSTEPEFNLEAPSARFYGGLVGFHSNNPRGNMSEGGINENHESRDDFNMMSEQSIAARKKGNFVQAYGCWYWKKEDFLNQGDQYPVVFDNESMIAVHISRYWDSVDGGRWVVGEGDKLYISESQFGTPEEIKKRGGKKTHLSWPCYPVRTKWAEYTPKGPHLIKFDETKAEFKEMNFQNVTGTGFYIEKDSLTEGVVSVKWHSFETYAVVKRPEGATQLIDMVKVKGGLELSKTEIPYSLWRYVYNWAVSNQFCFSLDERGYVFDRDGDMGSMDLAKPGEKHSADEPATDMTWLDAVAWCNAFSELEGLTPCYYADPEFKEVLRVIMDRTKPENYGWKPKVYINWKADGFRLPTSIEWAVGRKENGLQNSIREFVWDISGDAFDPDTADIHSAVGSDAGGNGYPVYPDGASCGVGFRIARGEKEPFVLDSPPKVELWKIRSSLEKNKPDLTIELAEVKNGTYERKDEATVTVSDFYMSKTEISFYQWNKVLQWALGQGYVFDRDGDMGSMDWRTEEFSHVPEEPVTDIGWHDAVIWCNALSELEGKTPVYYTDPDKTKVYRKAVRWRIRMIYGEGYKDKVETADIPVYVKWESDGYRLPTWAEFNIAWRDGDTSLHKYTSPWSKRELDREWLEQTAGGSTKPAGTRKPNSYGLFDLGGNVSELLNDSPVNDYYKAHNPKGNMADRLFGVVFAGSHFKGDPKGVGKISGENKKSAGWPWLGFRVVRCKAGAHEDKPFEPEVVLDVKEEDYDPLQGKTHRGNLARTGYMGPKGIPSLPSRKWMFKTEAPVKSSPVVVDSIVYVGSNDRQFYALNAADGTVKWKLKTDGPVTGSATVADGTVYIGAGSALYALDASNGEQKWVFRKNPKHEFAVGTSPAFAFNTVFIGMGKWSSAHILGIDAEKGEEVWKLRLASYNGGLLAPSIVGTKMYLPWGDIRISQVDIRTEIPDWTSPGNHCQASLAIANGMVMYNTGKQCMFYKQDDGSRMHNEWLKGEGLSFFPQSGPAAHDGTAYFVKSATHKLYAFDISGNEVKKKYEVPVAAEVNSSLAIAGGEIFFGGMNGNVYAHDLKTGEKKWEYNIGKPVWSSPWVDGNGALYVGSDDGNVYCLQ